MAALVYTDPVENNTKSLETENKVIRERLSNLGSLITSMEEFTKDKQPNPVFKDVIEEIQKVLEKYRNPANTLTKAGQTTIATSDSKEI